MSERERERGGGREGGTEGQREGGREREREGGRERETEGQREGERERGREGGREREIIAYSVFHFTCFCVRSNLFMIQLMKKLGTPSQTTSMWNQMMVMFP